MSTRDTYYDPSLPVSERIQRLMGAMTTEEKCGQLQYRVHVLDDASETHEALAEETKIVRSGLGNMFLSSRVSAGETARRLNRIQKTAREQTRLGIPVLVHGESLRGLLSHDATMFPQPLTLAATFDRDLAQRVFAAIAKESRSRGFHMSYSPVLDLGTDPRWGRIVETFGEDPCLVSEMGMACVTGYQHRKGRYKAGRGFEIEADDDVIDAEHIACTAKHFAGYGQCQGGRNFGPYNYSQQFLREHVFLPFKTAVERAGILGIMPGHHEVEGIPCHASTWLLDDVLRRTWGFDGIVVSDANDIYRLEVLHGVSSDATGSIRLALEAGVDIDILRSRCYSLLEDLITRGELDESLVDPAVERVLAMKIRLGLFEQPYVREKAAIRSAQCDAHIDLATEAAEKSVVLLKNESAQHETSEPAILPIDVKRVQTLAVIGPSADTLQFGGYSPHSAQGVSILDGITRFLAARASSVDVTWAQGCRITEHNRDAYETEVEAENARKNPATISDEQNADAIGEAVELARESDVVVLCVGGNGFTEREAFFAEGTRGDRGSLALAGSQEELIRQISATGTPVVLVVVAGGPVTLDSVMASVQAILWTGYHSARSGAVIADILFGKTNPSGKLPVTFPRSAGHLPCYYYQKPTGAFKEYLFEDSSPQFPFGFGLSYTTFDCSAPRLSAREAAAGTDIQVTVTVTNTGPVAGREVVQLYIRDDVCMPTRPVRELKDFAAVYLEPGEAQDLVFTLEDDAFAYVNASGEYGVETGTYTVSCGTRSDDLKSASLSFT